MHAPQSTVILNTMLRMGLCPGTRGLLLWRGPGHYMFALHLHQPWHGLLEAQQPAACMPAKHAFIYRLGSHW